MANFIDMHGFNIWDIPATVRVIPVNTVGTMGAGLAKQADERVPGLSQAYKKECKGGFKVGEIFVYPDSDCFYICFPSKEDWRDKAKLEHIVLGLQALAETLVGMNSTLGLVGNEHYPLITLSIPPVGAGLGNVARRQQWGEHTRIHPDAVRTLIKHHLALVPNLTVFVF